MSAYQIAIKCTEAAGVVMAVLIVCDFFNMFMEKKSKGYIRGLAAAAAAVICVSAVLCVGIARKESGFWAHYVAMAAASFASAIFLSFFYGGRTVKRLYLSAIITVLILLFEFLAALVTSVINGVAMDTFTEYLFFYMEQTVISKVILFAFIKIVGRRFIKPHDVIFPVPTLIVLMTLPAATFIVIMTMTYYDILDYDHRNSVVLLIAATALVAANIAFVYLLEWQAKELNRQKEESIRRGQLENQVEYYKKTLADRKKYNRMMHDLKNELFALQDILKKNSADGAERINAICKEVSDKGVNYTQNDSLNALIYSKVSGLDEKEISFSCHSVMSLKNSVDEMDLCVLVGNTLDNAIEACRGEGGKKIEMTILQQDDYLVYKLVNPASLPDGTYPGGEGLSTTKPDGYAHGFGIKSCKRIAEKYSGNLNISVKNGIFAVDVLLLNPVSEEAKTGAE